MSPSPTRLNRRNADGALNRYASGSECGRICRLMIEAAVSNLNAKQAKKKAEKALEAGDREEAKKILANVISANEHPPCPRLIINDATVEKLGELLNQNANGLLLIRDELAGS